MKELTLTKQEADSHVAGSVLTIKHVMPPHRAPYNRRTLWTP